MVIQELIRVIQASIGSMKRYPKLRHEIESVMCNFIRETEQNCKDHVRMLINCELAYINVGNEEFMEVHGLATVVSADQNERKASKKLGINEKIIIKIYFLNIF